MEFLGPMHEIARNELVENSITADEKERADLMEAILSYNTYKNARKSKEDIMKEIKELEAQHSIKFHDNLKPEPRNKMMEEDNGETDLDEIIFDMEWNAEEDKKATFDQLSGWFETLTEHYEQ